MPGRGPTKTTGSSCSASIPRSSGSSTISSSCCTATEVRGIDYPVAADNDYEVWRAFDNRYWPALYFVDREGIIRDEHFGEGRYEKSERIIQDLLGIEREPVSVEATGVEAEADWDHLRTPETYLGYGRGERFATTDVAAYDESRAYQLPERLGSTGGDSPASGRSTASASRVDEAGGSIAFRFHARDAHLVLSPGPHGADPVPRRARRRGPRRRTRRRHRPEGNGLLEEGRLYQLIREHDAVRERTLQITFLEPGAEAYAFTFG